MPKQLVCRWCDDPAPEGADSLSHWSHTHPASCPYRQDRVPALNGVRVGDHWRNLHTGDIVRVTELRLGGGGTYTDREPTVQTEQVKIEPGTEPTLADLPTLELLENVWSEGHPLWSLVEHWEPLTRPDDYPVPWEPCDRFPGSRSVPREWRCPGYRRADDSDPPYEYEPAYWHAFHTVRGHGIQWDRTNRIWQIDTAEPDAGTQLDLFAA